MEIDLSQIRTSQDALRQGLPVFKVISDGRIKAYKDENGVRRFEITASSDADDLVGDCFAEKALSRMESAAPGTTMFLNHQYNVPEDVFGSVEKATLVRRNVELQGGIERQCLCLEYKGIVEETNERAVKTHDIMIAGRVKLGGSVSVLIVEKGKTSDGRRRIEDVYYLECSVVGLPCNPTAWVTAASKALNLSEAEARDANLPAVEGDVQKAIPDQVQAVLLDAFDSALEAGDTQTASAQTAEVEEKTMTEGYIFKIAQKGMFNNILEARESSIYHLTDVLCSALWNLWSICYWDHPDDMDIEAELVLICDEFKEVAMARLLPLFQGYDDSEDKSFDAMATRLKAASVTLAFLGRADAVAKTIAEIAEKAGRRNSDSDQKMIDGIHSIIVDLGAECGESKAAPVGDTTATPVADKTAAASGDQSTLKALTDELSSLRARTGEAEELAEVATGAAEVAAKLVEQATSERDEALALATKALEALEAHGLQPIGR